MVLLRILAVVTLLLVSGSVLAYVFTRESRYLHFARRVFVGAVVVALLLFALLLLERLAVIPLPI